jgi:hypothetical protein
VALVRKRTIPTERPPLVGEVIANFCVVVVVVVVVIIIIIIIIINLVGKEMELHVVTVTVNFAANLKFRNKCLLLNNYKQVWFGHLSVG